jgi:superfamily II DNA/RNA helicase
LEISVSSALDATAAVVPDAPTFADLGVPAWLARSLTQRGLTSPFPIQAATLPDSLAGLDVCGRAPTGSGKTIAFGLPLVLRIGRAAPKRPRGLVLAPTRELAAQICKELRLIAPREVRIDAVYGGVGFDRQLKALRRGIDIVVACPGRLADLINQREVVLDDVDLVVIDEADRMADMGFLPEVKRLLDRCRSDRQTLLFSATLDGDVDVLIKRYQRNPVRHDLGGRDESESDAEHVFWDVDRTQRVGTVASLVAATGPTVVFCRTKRGADRVARQLESQGVRAVAIHGGRSQGQRDRALEAFKSGQAEAIVATDVAARGIHVDDVACVVHFDPAGDPKDYVHRSGRTGRAGASGLVVSLVPDEVRTDVQKMQRQLGRKITIVPPDPALVKPGPRRPPVKSVTSAPPAGGQRTDGQPRRSPGSGRGSRPGGSGRGSRAGRGRR